jgi:hypothetical protein
MKRQRGTLRYTSSYNNENAAYLHESMLSYNGARFPIRDTQQVLKDQGAAQCQSIMRQLQLQCSTYVDRPDSNRLPARACGISGRKDAQKRTKARCVRVSSLPARLSRFVKAIGVHDWP